MKAMQLVMWRRRVTMVVSLGTGGSFLLATPVLTWDGATDDNTPDFTIDLDENIAVGDVIRFQVDDTNTFPSPTEATNTLDSSEILAGLITETIGALANGTYYARARVERSSVAASDWSNIETITISATVAATTFYILGF